jgi:alcohol dehydrogenase (cytochrome c)
MTTRTCVAFLIALAFPLSGQVLIPRTTFAQASITGRWRAESNPPGTVWTAVLRADGTRVIGAVSSCASNQGAEISDGAISRDAITFQCRVGRRHVTFTGTVKGDEIDFSWMMPVSVDDFPVAPTDRIFGGAGPRRFTARRVPDVADAVTTMADRARKAPAVSFDRILHADKEPHNWLSYSGTLLGHRYSQLTQITPANIKNLELAWIWQTQASPGGFQATPLVVDGVLYTVEAPNNVAALDAATGRVLWRHAYNPAPTARVAGHIANRGLAILGGTLFMGTMDAHLLAIDAYSGKLIWNVTVANARDPACNLGRCYGMTHAPLVVKDKVIVGVAGGDDDEPGKGIRGFIAAFDAVSGKEVWRSYTVPATGESGNNTWSGDSWKTGGAGVWNTGTYDPELNLTFWGTGNPAPPRNGSSRLGDNLYSNSVVALDADAGTLRWYYQFTPHDDMDWDAAQVPVLVDLQWEGRLRKVMVCANRNGVLYVLDRSTGQFLSGKPFVDVNWMTGFDATGRPIRAVGKVSGGKTLILPGDGTNWYPPSYSPRTSWFYVSSWERGSQGGAKPRATPGYGAIRAFDARTGERKWEFRKNDAIFSAGVLTTASDLLFTGVQDDPYSETTAARLADRYFYALDARTGDLLWHMVLTGSVQSAPISYAVNNRQHIAIAAGDTLFAFAVRQ